MSNIAEKVQFYRNKLLDPSVRNPLINYHPKKIRSIAFQNLDPIETYSNLVVNKRKPQIKSIQLRDRPSSEQNLTVSPEEGKLFTLRSVLDTEDLNYRLLSLHKQSLTAFEEQGYTILYLALGFLYMTT